VVVLLPPTELPPPPQPTTTALSSAGMEFRKVLHTARPALSGFIDSLRYVSDFHPEAGEYHTENGLMRINSFGKTSRHHFKKKEPS